MSEWKEDGGKGGQTGYMKFPVPCMYITCPPFQIKDPRGSVVINPCVLLTPAQQPPHPPGEVSRADVAATCVNALFAPDAADSTFEVYAINRRTTLQSEFPATSGYEHRAAEWPALFQGLRKDSELK